MSGGRKSIFFFWSNPAVSDSSTHTHQRSITSSYYRGANGVILVYDVTNGTTFANLENWIVEVNRYTADDVPKFLVGNKLDLASASRAVPLQTAKDFAESLRFPVFEVSAKDGKNTEETFLAIAKEVKKRASAPAPVTHAGRIVINPQPAIAPRQEKKPCSC